MGLRAADAGDGNRIFKVSAKTGGIGTADGQALHERRLVARGDRIVYYDWSPGGANEPLLAISPDKSVVGMPPNLVYRGDREGYRLMPDGKNIVILDGQFREQNFWQVHLETGERRQLTRLKPGYSVRSFDISPDGKEILFDRVQENSDIVLIDRR